MRSIHAVSAGLGIAISAVAQCGVAPPAQVLATRDPFAATFHFGCYFCAVNDLVQYFDTAVTAPLTVTAIDATTYDQGVPGGPLNQVGATGTVKIWSVPTTWVGNTLGDPSLGGTAWTLRGTGTITVTAWPASSPIAIATPFVLPVGTYGVAIEMEPTTNGPNPGPLHTLATSPNAIPDAHDAYLRVTNQAIQQLGWISTPIPQVGLNLRIHYTPDPSAAYTVPFGAGCSSRPQAFWERFHAAAGAPDLANTGIVCTPVGASYAVAAAAPAIVPPVSPSLTLGAYGASSTGNWDDALSVPIALPFLFAYPGGSTSAITISSNGKVFLAAETSGSPDVCGAPYDIIERWRDNKPAIAVYWQDLDASAGGGIHYDVDPGNAWVRITWDQVPEWLAPSVRNTMQLTLWADGRIDMSFGSLGNQMPDNAAICGFTPGNGSRLPAPQDLSATMPFQSGDGAMQPILDVDVRPALGASPNLRTTDLVPNASFVLHAIGLGVPPASVGLGSLGMPGCFLHIDPLTTALAPVVGGVALSPVGTIPSSASWLGTTLYAQAAALAPGFNAGGALVSSGLCLRIGAW